MSWTVVVPTNRPERFGAFLDAWEDEFSRRNVHVIVVQDLPGKDPEIDRATWHRRFVSFELHDWSTIPLTRPAVRSDMIRSWGICRAYRRAGSFVLTLDDDTLPGPDVFGSYERVFEQGAVLSDYLDVGALTTAGRQMRGFPYRDRRKAVVGLQYGGWNGVLDYDACTQLAGVNDHELFRPVVMPVPRGAAVTGCIMNAAWRREFCPIMWQLPLLDGRFNRFGDIWAGLFAKKTLDSVGVAVVVNGEASVRHERASDPLVNLEREQPGVGPNEQLWDNLSCDSPDLLTAYRQVTSSAHRFFRFDPEYAEHFLGARDEWLALF